MFNQMCPLSGCVTKSNPMANANDFGVGLMHELAITAAKVGWEPKNMADLAKNEKMVHSILSVIKGHSEVKMVEHLIDTDATPILPFGGARIEKHQKGGTVKIEKKDDGLYIDGKKVILHLSKKQINEKMMKGYDLCKELAGKKVLNACVLDYLLANPHLIPEDWKKDENGNTRYIFFWDTIFRNSSGYLYVRYLCFYGGEWRSDYDWLAHDWDGNNPAALLAS